MVLAWLVTENASIESHLKLVYFYFFIKNYIYSIARELVCKTFFLENERKAVTKK